VGVIQREQHSPACAATFHEALDLAKRIDDATIQAACAFNLGHACKDIADLRNLDEMEGWYRMSLDLHAPNDGHGRAQCLAQLGGVAFERFKDAETAKRPAGELKRRIEEAAQLCREALDMAPASAVTTRGIIHGQLGVIYQNAGNIDRALHHFQEDIRSSEKTGDIFRACETRLRVTLALCKANRLCDARAYAEAALANFRTFGGRAADEIQKIEHLIAAIDQDIATMAGGT
jgi:tetratricopeptide (TPR) repeat protein